MQLKELKKEIENLPDIDEHLKSFSESWLEPFLSNTGNYKFNQRKKHLKSLKKLTNEEQLEINEKIKTFYKIFESLKFGQITSNKMHTIGRSLIELKLMSFQLQNSTENGNFLMNSGTGKKYNYVTNKIIDDDFNGIKPIINEIKEFDFNLLRLEDIYKEVNQYLYNKLPLEHSVILMNKPHGNHFKKLKDVSKRRKRLIKDLGINFIALQQEMRKRPKSYTEKSLNLSHD